MLPVQVGMMCLKVSDRLSSIAVKRDSMTADQMLRVFERAGEEICPLLNLCDRSNCYRLATVERGVVKLNFLSEAVAHRCPIAAIGHNADFICSFDDGDSVCGFIHDLRCLCSFCQRCDGNACHTCTTKQNASSG